MTELFRYYGIHLSSYFVAAISFIVFVGLSFLIEILFVKVLKELAKKTQTQLDDQIIAALHRPIFITLILVGIIIIKNDLLIEYKISSITNGVVYTLITLIWAFAFIRITGIIVKNSINRISSDSGLSTDIIPLLSNFFKFTIIAAGITVILVIWKVDVTPILASAGVLSIIIALAAKDTLANFFGGISIFIDKPYRIGDYVVLDDKERGEVVDIGIRSTRIKTRDDILISIPNSIIANSKIVNESAPIKHFRVRIPVGVAYGTDVNLLEEILVDIAKKNENIIPLPEPHVRLRQFGESSLDFELMCWAKEPAIRGRTIHQIGIEILKRFKEAGIVIPFPQRDLHIKDKER